MRAAAFRAWMEGHALTLDRAAEALGLSRRNVAYYLSGEQPVPKTVMLATEGMTSGGRLEGFFFGTWHQLFSGTEGPAQGGGKTVMGSIAAP
jgi:transcriptional regulator with XRE-family HTH domain